MYNYNENKELMKKYLTNSDNCVKKGEDGNCGNFSGYLI
jgi:hypothetical protein